MKEQQPLDHIKPQVVAKLENGALTILEDSWLNKNLLKPDTRYLVNIEEIDDSADIPGIAAFTITRNDGTKEQLYGMLGVDYPPE